MLLHSALRRRLGADYRLNFAAGLAGLGDADLRGLAEECLAGIHALAPQARHITDKMPSNFMQIGLMNALFPNARIIHCRRDPLDTCVSCFTTLFKSGQSFSYDLKELGEFYGLYNTCDLWPARPSYCCILPMVIIEPGKFGGSQGQRWKPAP